MRYLFYQNTLIFLVLSNLLGSSQAHNFVLEQDAVANLFCEAQPYGLEITQDSLIISGFSVTNSGTESSPACKIGIYLTANGVLDQSALLLEKIDLPGIAPSSSRNIRYQKSLNEISSGLYTVVLLIDDEDVVEETNEADNLCVFNRPSLGIGQFAEPDLVFSKPAGYTVNGSILSISGVDVCNIGNAAGGFSFVGYYLSLDEIITTEDFFLGEELIQPISASDPELCDPTSFEVSLSGIPNGSYYVGIIADYRKEIGESNEENNSCYYSDRLVIENNPNPDKANIVCGSLGTLEVNGNQVSLSNFEVKNTGGTIAPTSVVGFYLSTDPNVDRNDTKIGMEGVPSLNPGTSHFITISTIVTTLSNGTYYFGMVVDDTGTVDETSGEDNFCSFSSPVELITGGGGGKANIVCGALGNLEVNGNQFSLTNFEVRNTGGTTAPASIVKFYLSTDSSIDRNDNEIGSENVSTLTPGETTTLSFNTTVTNLPDGSYYFGMVVDATGIVDETSGEDNFCSFSDPIELISGGGGDGKANIVCGALGNLEVNGNQFSLTNFEVRNTGATVAPASVVKFYLSTDSNVDRNDFEIGSENVSTLTPGETTPLNFNTTVTNLSDGSYYFGMVVDATGTVDETSGEDNFCSFSDPIELLPGSGNGDGKANIVCGALGNLEVNGNQINLNNFEVRNTGGTTAPASVVKFYLSTDSNVDRNDFEVGFENISPLAPGGTTTLNFNTTVTNLLDGSYYFGMVVDATGTVDETSGEDNFCSFSNRVELISGGGVGKANIICGALGDLEVNGNQITLNNFEIRNIGGITAPTSVAGFYLSTDANVDRNDFEIGQKDVKSLTPNESDFVTFSTTVSGLANGTYYFGIVLDRTGTVDEASGEDNFCHFGSERVIINSQQGEPNLVCPPRGVISISQANISLTGLEVENRGEVRSNPCRLGYYLSLDDRITTDDILIETDQIPILNPGEKIEQSFSVTVSGINPGSYFVGMIVDDQSEVQESNEEDNWCYFESPTFEFSLSNVKANLVCSHSGEFTQVNEELSVLEFTVDNIGTIQAGASKVGFYLSPDQSILRSDLLLGKKGVGSINPGESRTISFETSLSGYPEGEYYLGMIVDVDGEVIESSGEDNFCFFSNRKVNIFPPPQLPEGKANLVCGDLGSLSIGSTSVGISGFQVRNIGGTDAGANTVGVYLSTDANITRDDLRVGEWKVSSLGKGQTRTLLSKTFQFFGIPPGSYFLGVVVDDLGEVPETNGGDNFCHYSSERILIRESASAETPASIPTANLVCGELGTPIIFGAEVRIPSFRVNNIGLGPAAPSSVGFYLSLDDQVRRDDIKIGSVNIKDLEAGESTQNTFITTIAGVPNGEYFLGLVVDDSGDIPESDGNDNFCTFPDIKVTIEAREGPNLVCELGINSEISYINKQLSVSNIEVQNIGDFPSSFFRVGYYLSTDPSITQSDLLIGESELLQLETSGKVNLSFNQTLSNLANG
ncbi:MAG: CARDB domain-containing protein, partial [Bacteroidota bacterium]